MRTLLVSTILLLEPSVAIAKTFVCDVKSTTTFGSGTFKAIANEANWLKLIKTVTFDEDTGIFRYGSEGAWQQFTMKVLQRGTSSNSTLAVYSHQGVARHVLNTLRISGWDKGAPFAWDNEGEFFAGNCVSYGN